MRSDYFADFSNYNEIQKDAKEVTDLSKLILSSHANNFNEDRLSRDSRISNETVGRFYSKWISNSLVTQIKVYSLASGLCITQLKQDILKIDLLSAWKKEKAWEPGSQVTYLHMLRTQVRQLK